MPPASLADTGLVALKAIFLQFVDLCSDTDLLLKRSTNYFLFCQFCQLLN